MWQEKWWNQWQESKIGVQHTIRASNRWEDTLSEHAMPDENAGRQVAFCQGTAILPILLFWASILCWNTSLILYEVGPQRSTDEIYNRMIWIQSWKLLVSYFGRYCHPIKQSEDWLEWRDSTRDSLLKRMQSIKLNKHDNNKKVRHVVRGKHVVSPWKCQQHNCCPSQLFNLSETSPGFL